MRSHVALLIQQTLRIQDRRHPHIRKETADMGDKSSFSMLRNHVLRYRDTLPSRFVEVILLELDSENTVVTYPLD